MTNRHIATGTQFALPVGRSHWLVLVVVTRVGMTSIMMIIISRIRVWDGRHHDDHHDQPLLPSAARGSTSSRSGVGYRPPNTSILRRRNYT
jgi:hypothetical protein